MPSFSQNLRRIISLVGVMGILIVSLQYSAQFSGRFLLAALTDGMNATNVLGQSSFTVNDSGITQSTMENPEGSAYDSANNRLFVADSTNNRVLIFNLASITNGENAVNVLGQSDFTSNSPATTQSGMNTPFDVAYDGTNSRLFVAEITNNRVLIFDVSSITNGENASNVLGQSDFDFNDAATTQSGMSGPNGVAYDGTNSRLFVADSTNNRVLIFDVSSISDGENASNVLGQNDFITSIASTTQDGMSAPISAAYDGTNSRLFVADSVNNRVLIFDVSSITNGENASNVLGQLDFASSGPNTTQSSLNTPLGLTYDSTDDRVFVADTTNNRVVVFDVSSITNGENAVNVLGQSTFTDSTRRITQSGMDTPEGVRYDTTNGGRLFVADTNNNRVLIFTDLATDTTAPTVSTLSPIDGATGVSRTANLVITFSESVKGQTGNIEIKKSSDDSTAETIDITSALVTGSGTDTITINPSITLGWATSYYINIDATAFDDLAGNSYAGMSDTTTWNFTSLSSTCGNGVVEDAEECDDGGSNANTADACRTNCVNPFCGDSILDTGEACEPAGQGTCNNQCQEGRSGGGGTTDRGPPTPVPEPFTIPPPNPCGNGTLEPELGEQCDKGLFNGVSDCSNECTILYCGDGIISLHLNEECEPQTTTGSILDPETNEPITQLLLQTPTCGISCSLPDINACTITGGCIRLFLPSCPTPLPQLPGMKVPPIDIPTETIPAPAPECFLPDVELEPDNCGNGQLEPEFDEECDDGDQNGFTTCSQTCKTLFCGDGIISNHLGEGCEIFFQGELIFYVNISTFTTENFYSSPGCGRTCTLPTLKDQCTPEGGCQIEDLSPCITETTTVGRGTATRTAPAPSPLCQNPEQLSQITQEPATQISPACGDGTLAPNGPDGISGTFDDEECDRGGSNGASDCNIDCTLFTCGDGITSPQIGEECEPIRSHTGEIFQPACGSTCTIPTCDENGENCSPGCQFEERLSCDQLHQNIQATLQQFGEREVLVVPKISTGSATETLIREFLQYWPGR